MTTKNMQSTQHSSLILLLAVALVAALAVPAAMAQNKSGGDTPGADVDAPRANLAAAAAAVYERAARFPEHSRAVEPGATDPVRAKRVPAPHSLPSRDGSATITVWPREVSFQHPAPVELYATVDRRGPGGFTVGKLDTSIVGEVVDAEGRVVTTVSYRDDGKGADRRAKDGIHTASFDLPPEAVPELAASFGVRIAAVGDGGETIGVTGGFLYSNPHARLTGEMREELRDGSLVLSVEVKVETAGRFHLAGTLAEMKGAPVGTAQAAAVLEPGVHWLELEFYGLMFRDRGVAGPFRVASLAFSTVTGMPNALNDLVEDGYRTRAYPAAAFTDRAFGEPGLVGAAARLRGER
ncbi:MAG TPA: hypothetical protein VKU40_05925 [Thermoanaerobaculia bacterium]|nr:hypothetical protein [Thermoanaerobaculia bacterium]